MFVILAYISRTFSEHVGGRTDQQTILNSLTIAGECSAINCNKPSLFSPPLSPLADPQSPVPAESDDSPHVSLSGCVVPPRPSARHHQERTPGHLAVPTAEETG